MTLRLLVADDNAAMHKMVRLAFAGDDAVIETVSSGDAALEILNEFSPDAVLADVSMPGYSGYEVCELIRHDPRFAAVPVILMNGALEHFDEEEAARVEASGHLTKPFDPSEMISLVEKLLSESWSRQAHDSRDGKASQKEDKAEKTGAETETAAEISAPPAGFIDSGAVLSAELQDVELHESASGKTPESHAEPAAPRGFFHVSPRAWESYLGPDSILEIFDDETFDGKAVDCWQIPDELVDRVAERVMEKMRRTP